MHSCHLLLDQVQFTLIHGPNIPDCYAVLSFTALDFILPPNISTTGHHFHFGPDTSFFLKPLVIAFRSSLISYWTPSNLGAHLLCHIFLPFLIVHGFLTASRLVWFAIPSSSRPHILSELFTVTYPSWVALHSLAHSFTELCEPLCHKGVSMKGNCKVTSL